MRNLGSSIYWLETSHRPLRPSLTGTVDVDVAIVGGGFTGLWTAYQLLVAEPSLRIAVLEQEQVGFGASGRNGGFAMTLLDMSLSHLRRNHGDGAAKAAHDAVATSVEEIGATVAERGIDCEWVHGGLMVVATNPGQLRRVDADLDAAHALDLDGFRKLSASETQAEVHSPTYVGALMEEHCGVLHPAKLAHGLADVVETMGATIYERTASVAIDDVGGKLRVKTDTGEVRADQVVLSTNAWAGSTPWFKSKVVPLYTYIVLTEPLDGGKWAAIGWDRSQGIEDKRNYVHYYRRTLDGRILWGGSDGIIYPGGAIRPSHDRSKSVFQRLERTFRTTFPQLRDVRFSHQWGGPVAITVSFMPMFGTLLDGRLHYGLGYNGHGVAPSHTGGKILRDKVLGRPSDLTELCFVDSKEPGFPPEPLRWISAELTRRSLLRQDAQLDAGKLTGDMDPLLLRAMKKLG
jgi:glycine/D-amino acid oxidase-like deaminating enzyme